MEVGEVTVAGMVEEVTGVVLEEATVEAMVEEKAVGV